MRDNGRADMKGAGWIRKGKGEEGKTAGRLLLPRTNKLRPQSVHPADLWSPQEEEVWSPQGTVKKASWTHWRESKGFHFLFSHAVKDRRRMDICRNRWCTCEQGRFVFSSQDCTPKGVNDFRPVQTPQTQTATCHLKATLT